MGHPLQTCRSESSTSSGMQDPMATDEVRPFNDPALESPQVDVNNKWVNPTDKLASELDDVLDHVGEHKPARNFRRLSTVNRASPRRRSQREEPGTDALQPWDEERMKLMARAGQ